MSVSVVDAGPRRVCRSVEVAAPAAELFAMAADPRRHHELDGSGTVRGNIKVPAEMAVGSKFSTSMKMYGLPYRITSTVTAFKPNELVEWRHPVGHRWRWEFAELSPTLTRVTETFEPKNLEGRPAGVFVCIGQVVGVHIDEAVLTDGLFDAVKAGNLSRLGYMDFAAVTETFAMRRPKWRPD